MRDYNYVREDGTKVPTSQITDQEIHELLAGGVEIVSCDDEPLPNVENVLERLRIELVIRGLDRQ